MGQADGLSTLTRLTELDQSLQDDFSGQTARALIDDLGANARATRTLLVKVGPADQRTALRLVTGFEAAQRVVREVWEQMHGSALHA
jgi:hypothetical protein